MQQIIVRTEELADIPALERKHNAKLLQAHILGEEAIAEMLPVASLEFFVNVWNCQATLYLVYGGECTPAEEVLELDAEAWEELLDRVVYTDNDGAITISGQYFPQSERSLALFRRLMETAKPKSDTDNTTRQ